MTHSDHSELNKVSSFDSGAPVPSKLSYELLGFDPSNYSDLIHKLSSTSNIKRYQIMTNYQAK